MFRFLDKRFYHRGRWEFDLRAFACEHVGLSKNYSNSELKRKLQPAVRELEERGFLEPLPDAVRFVQVRVGEWRAVFVKARPKVTVLSSGEEAEPLVKELVARGITRRSAVKLVTHHPAEHVREKIKLFDSLKTRGGEGAIRNRAGWLYAAIVNDFSGPEEKPRVSTQKQTGLGTEAAQTQAAKEELAPLEPVADTGAFDAFWGSLTEAKRAAFEEEAVAVAPAFLQMQYYAQTDRRGTLWRVARQRILVAHYLATKNSGDE